MSSPVGKIADTLAKKKAAADALVTQNAFNEKQAKTPVEGDAINKKLRNISNLRLGIGSTFTGAGLQPQNPMKSKLGA